MCSSHSVCMCDRCLIKEAKDQGQLAKDNLNGIIHRHKHILSLSYTCGRAVETSCPDGINNPDCHALAFTVYLGAHQWHSYNKIITWEWQGQHRSPTGQSAMSVPRALKSPPASEAEPGWDAEIWRSPHAIRSTKIHSGSYYTKRLINDIWNGVFLCFKEALCCLYCWILCHSL